MLNIYFLLGGRGGRWVGGLEPNLQDIDKLNIYSKKINMPWKSLLFQTKGQHNTRD